MQPPGIHVVGGSNPSQATLAPPPAAAKMSAPGFEPTPANLASAALPLDRWLSYQHRASPLLVAYSAKTFDPPPTPPPPPPPPLKKVISSFRG